MKKIIFAGHLLIASTSFLVIISCNRNKKPTVEQVVMKYNNGQIFCEGSYNNYESGRQTKIGIWNEYYPLGQVASITEYGRKGDPVSVKEFREDGSILLSANYSDQRDIEVYYYENGKIRLEVLTTYYEDNDEDGNSKYSKSLETEYYKSGKVRSKRNYRNDDLNGETIMWDENGQTILNCKYSKGLISYCFEE